MKQCTHTSLQAAAKSEVLFVGPIRAEAVGSDGTFSQAAPSIVVAMRLTISANSLWKRDFDAASTSSSGLEAISARNRRAGLTLSKVSLFSSKASSKRLTIRGTLSLRFSVTLASSFA